MPRMSDVLYDVYHPFWHSESYEGVQEMAHQCQQQPVLFLQTRCKAVLVAFVQPLYHAVMCLVKMFSMVHL